MGIVTYVVTLTVGKRMPQITHFVDKAGADTRVASISDLLETKGYKFMYSTEKHAMYHKEGEGLFPKVRKAKVSLVMVSMYSFLNELEI